MDKIHIIPSEFNQSLELQLAYSIKAVFRECVTLECKRAKTEVPKSVWETYSAFANTIGGTILLGIENIKIC